MTNNPVALAKRYFIYGNWEPSDSPARRNERLWTVAPSSNLFGFKGNSILDTGYIYAPYTPIFIPQCKMTSPIDLKKYRAILVSKYGQKLANQEFSVATIENEKPAYLMVWVRLVLIKKVVKDRKKWNLDVTPIHEHDLSSPTIRPALLIYGIKPMIYLPFTDAILVSDRGHMGLDSGYYETIKIQIKANMELAICADEAINYGVRNQVFGMSPKTRTAVKKERSYKKHL